MAAVVRQDQVGPVADQEAVAHGNPGLFDRIELLEQRHGVDHDPVAEDRRLVRP